MIMSRSVKSVCIWPDPAGPKITCSIIFRIIIVVLIIQLHDTLAHQNRNSRKHWPGPNGNLFDDHNSIRSDDYKKSFGMKFRSPHFEVRKKEKAFKSSKVNIKTPEDIVREAQERKIFLNPIELEARMRNSKPTIRILGEGKDESIFKPNVPDHCKDRLICNENPSYPALEIEKMIRKLTDLRILTRVNEPIGTRPWDKDSVSLCNSSVVVYSYPVQIRKEKIGEESNWHWVVNAETFRQRVAAAYCLHEDSPCGADINDSFKLSSGRTAICKQQYYHQPMLVISRDNGTIIPTDFPIPSGCCCHNVYRDVS